MRYNVLALALWREKGKEDKKGEGGREAMRKEEEEEWKLGEKREEELGKERGEKRARDTREEDQGKRETGREGENGLSNTECVTSWEDQEEEPGSDIRTP